MKDLSLIVPAYNEVDRIQPTLESYDKEMKNICQTYEILVVDDGSDDGTAEFVKSLKSQMPNLRVIKCKENRGKGNAVRVGMLHAKGKIRVMTDADGSIPAEQLRGLVLPLLTEEADIAIGSRYVKGAVVENKQPLYRRIWSRFANIIIQKMLLPGIVDTQCGFKAFRASVAERVFAETQIDGWSFDLEVLALAQMQGYKIKEVPVSWSDDERSKGKFSQLPETIAELFRIHRSLREKKRAIC